MEDLHFMVDRETIKRIIAATDIKPEETILEIGAGKGELTAFLCKKAQVIAIEKDRVLCTILRKRFRKNKNVRVIQGNALLEMEKFKCDKIVSNLPYSLTQPLFQRLPSVSFRSAFFTLPKNFSLRLKSLPYSAFFETEILFSIPKKAFSPPPRTNSVFVRVLPLKSLLGTILLMRKSKLKNAIKGALIREKGMTKQQAKEALNSLPLTTLVEKRIFDLDLSDLKKLEIVFQNFK